MLKILFCILIAIVGVILVIALVTFAMIIIASAHLFKQTNEIIRTINESRSFSIIFRCGNSSHTSNYTLQEGYKIDRDEFYHSYFEGLGEGLDNLTEDGWDILSRTIIVLRSLNNCHIKSGDKEFYI